MATETATRHDKLLPPVPVNGYRDDEDQSGPSSGAWNDGPEAEESGPGALRLDPHSPMVNPFHFLSHPHSPSAVDPLPPHLENLTMETDNGPRIVSEFHDTDLANGSAPVHITKVTRKAVQVTSGPSSAAHGHRRIIQKVNKVFKNEANGREAVLEEERVLPAHSVHRSSPESRFSSTSRRPLQQAPPSPPISDVDVVETTESIETETVETETGAVEDSQDARTSSSHATEEPDRTPRPAFTPMLTAEPSDFAPSQSPVVSQRTPSPVTATDYFFMNEGSPARSISSQGHLAVPSRRRISNSSTSSRTGSLAVVRASRLAQQRASPVDGAHAEVPGEAPEALGGDITPSSSRTAQPRINRRMTQPSPPISTSPIIPQRVPLQHSQSTFSTSSNPNAPAPLFDGSALDPDILAQTEVIRRERLERRRKKAEAEAQAGAAAAVTQTEAAPEAPREKAEAKRDKEKEEATKVLVGNLIGEDHVNYVLMYNMLTGIRIGVSRCQAKLARPLTDEDYTARHKFSFDIVGNELTPSARYDFKFKDYAPWVFRDLRDEHFHLDPADYLLSLTAKYILSELGSPGKSGSFFYFSRDYRFIIKTISHSEHKFLRSILKDYHEHVKNNPHTLLSRFYGLHRVKLPRGRKIHFVIMNNLFPPHRDIHETYDLKGSAYGREYPEEKAKQNPRAVLKDKNWVNRGRTLELGPEKRALFSEQLRRDMEFLKHVHVMDYSLLVGIHNMERGNRDNLRETSLHIFHPEMRPPKPIRRKLSIKPPSEASNMRKAVRRSDPKLLDVSSQLPADGSADRRHFLFYQDEGGLRATDEANQDMDVIYYLGIIDICTPYHTVKKLEHFWKAMVEDRVTISCVDPVTYGRRFLNFLLSVMRNGDLSQRPAGLLPAEPDSPESPVGHREDRPFTTLAEAVEENATSPISPAEDDSNRLQTPALPNGALGASLGELDLGDRRGSIGWNEPIPEENGETRTENGFAPVENGERDGPVDEGAAALYEKRLQKSWSGSSQEPQPAIVGHLKAD